MTDTPHLRLLVMTVLLVATFLPRLASLGTILTVDENLWRGRGEQFIKAFASGHFDKTLVAGQPGVTTAWLVGLSYPWQSLASSQAAIGLATGCLILLIVYGLTRLWGFWWAATAGFFLALDPFLLAHSRLVHTDALFALFSLASFLFLLAAFQTLSRGSSPVRRYLILSAALTVAAILTKTFGVFLLPVSLILIVFFWLRGRLARVVLWESIAVWAAVFILTLFAFWPALWTDPAAVVQYLTGRVALHAAEGTHTGETTTAWWYYAREGVFRLTAITTLLLLPAIPRLVRPRSQAERAALILLAIGVAFALAMSFSIEKSDRYIIFSLLTVTLTAVLGLQTLQSKISARYPRLLPWIPICVVVLLALNTVRLHPYYLAHYNLMYPVETTHKLGWGEGLEKAAEYISDRHPGAKVASYYNNVFSSFYAGPTQNLSGDTNADFLVLYRSMFERGLNHPDTDLVNQYLLSGRHQPEHVVTINNLPYVWIFKNE